MGEIRKVRIGSIDGPYRDRFSEGKKINSGFYKKSFVDYDWDELRGSLDEYGYNTDRFAHITVTICNTCETEGRYTVKDGNHRLYILREMFGDEYLVLVKRVINLPDIVKCGWCDKVKELSKTTTGKLELINVIVISTAFLLLYIKPTLIFMGVVLGVIIVSTTGVFDIKKETYDKNSHKYGGIIGKLINMTQNIPMIVIVIASIYYVWHLININIYAFMMIVGFTLIMGYLIGYYEKKEKKYGK